MKHLMIDIETLSTNARNAVMIQLAAKFFDPDNPKADGPEFCQSISSRSCIALGFETDPDTVEWWAQPENKKAYEEVCKNPRNVGDVMLDFDNFISKHNFEAEQSINDIFVWSHATFDFSIVQNYFRAVGVPPMPFWITRDLWTLVDVASINVKDYKFEGDKHNAIDDCRHQIRYTIDALNYIKEGNQAYGEIVDNQILEHQLKEAHATIAELEGKNNDLKLDVKYLLEGKE